MERTKQVQSYFFVAYLIPYNKPQKKYGNFQTIEDILKDSTLRLSINDYIFKKSKGGFLYIYSIFTKKGWKELPEVIEYEQDIIHTDLFYIK